MGGAGSFLFAGRRVETEGKNVSESDSSGGEPLETGRGRQKANRRLRSDALL